MNSRRLIQRLKRVRALSAANSWLKAHQQESQAAIELLAYRTLARTRGVAPVEARELTHVLRQRLAGRSAGRWPKQKGQLHIFLAYSVHNWEAILPRALAPFGKVTAFDWAGRGYDLQGPNREKNRSRMNQAMLEEFQRAHSNNRVDAVVGYLSGANTHPSTIEAMRQAGAAVFNFCWDDKLHFRGPKERGLLRGPAALASTVDLNLTNAPDSVVKYAVHDGLALFWAEAAHPDVHRPHDLPFEYDVSFVGQSYGPRTRFISSLHALGIQVTCFGPGWPLGTLSGDDMVRLYSRSRINLGFGGVGHSMRLTCLKGRDFEVPMSGGLYLTQHHRDLSLVYEVGREIVAYNGVRDCAATIRQLLANPERAAEIRRAGRARALRQHTYEARWNEVFRIAGLIV